MSPKFVISHLDQQLGPFDEAELRAKWSKGELLPIDYVYDEAKKDWILLAERFDWAAGLSDVAPPPLKVDMGKKKAFPPNPSRVATPSQAVTPSVPAATPAPAVAVAASPAPLAPSPNTIAIHGQGLLTEWRKPGSQGAKIKIVDGKGEVDLSQLAPGQLELVLQDSSAATLKLQEPMRIQVLPVEPEAIQWSFNPHQVVGKDLEIQIKAVDGKGNPCAHYADDFTVVATGDSGVREIKAQLVGGIAIAKFSHTKSENWTLALKYHGSRDLRLPESKTCEWQPGPATRLILDGPPELIAGNPLKVQVKAVDQYGNLAKTFQGTVILEVKAS